VLVVGRCCCRWWGGAGPLSSLVGWCWAVVVAIGGVVLGRCWCSWGGGPGSSSLMLGVVMGHHLGGWWWALIAVRVDTLLLHSIVVVVACCHHPSIIVMLCWVEIGRRTMIVRCPVATLLTWHLAPGLANSKGEGGLTSSLSIVWQPCRRLQHGNSGSRHHCLASMWPVVRFVHGIATLVIV